MAPIAAAVFALAAAWAWAINGVLVRRGVKRPEDGLGASYSVAMYGLALPWTVHLAGWAAGSWHLLASPWSIAFFLVSGMLGAGLGRLASYRGVTTLGPSVNSAALSMRPVVAGLLAFVFLAERPGPATLGGIMLIVSGLTLLPLSRGGERSGWRGRHLAFPAAAAALFAVADVVRRAGLTKFAVPLFFAAGLHEAAGLAVLAGLWRFSRSGRLAGPRPKGRGLFVAAMAATSSQILVFAALSTGPVALTIALVSTAPIWTTVLGFFVLRGSERITPASIAATALCVLGSVLVVLD